MQKPKTHKKNLIVSYKNLSEDIKELFRAAYPDGYTDYMQKTVKPNGEPIFVVPLELEDTCYMVKFDVKIDSSLVDDDIDKDLYSDDDKAGDGEYAPLSEVMDKEEDSSHKVGTLKHGDYEDILASPSKDSKSGLSARDIDVALDDEDEFDSYVDEDTDDEDVDDDEEEDDDFEPSEEDLLSIENEFLGDDMLPAGSKQALKEEPAPKRKPRKKATDSDKTLATSKPKSKRSAGTTTRKSAPKTK